MKKRFGKVAIAAILSTALIFVYSAGALAVAVMGIAEADTPIVTLTASASHAAFSLNRSTDDLFDAFKDVMPGDTLEQNLIVQTAAGNPAKYRIYLYARGPENLAEPEPVSMLLSDEESPATPKAFFDRLGLRVTDGDTVLNVMDAGTGTAGVYLGSFAANESKTLKVTLTADTEMGNAFQGAEALVRWSFYAEQEASGSTGGGGGGGGGSNPTPPDPDIDIPDEDTPLGDLDPPEEPDVPEIEIEDSEVPQGSLPEIDIPEQTIPLSGIPKTGDDSNPLPFIILMVVSGTGLVGLLVTGGKSENT